MKTRIQVMMALILGLSLFVQCGVCQTSTTSTPTTSSTGATSSTSTPIQVDPAITPEEAHEQAVSETPNPQQVFDLTNSGIVYGILKEGVAAWLASLEGNHDQWGNEVSTVYVSATRPDVVPASLQTFLLSYYKDNPTIGLAYGPEGVKEAETQLDKAYNEAIEGKADQLYQDAVDEAAAEQEALEQQQEEDEQNSDETDDSEDVPPLDDDTDNGDDTDTGDDTGNDEDEDPVTAANITSISPSDFEITSTSQVLDIIGEGFGTDASVVTVDFSNGFKGIVPDSVTETSIKVKVPAEFIAGTDISVTVNKAETVSSGVLITARPTISSVSPTTVRDNETLIIKGYGFNTNSASANTIIFDAVDDDLNVDSDKPAKTAEFISTSNQSQLTVQVSVSSETVGEYIVTVITNELEAGGSETITCSVD